MHFAFGRVRRRIALLRTGATFNLKTDRALVRTRQIFYPFQHRFSVLFDIRIAGMMD